MSDLVAEATRPMHVAPSVESEKGLPAVAAPSSACVVSELPVGVVASSARVETESKDKELPVDVGPSITPVESEKKDLELPMGAHMETERNDMGSSASAALIRSQATPAKHGNLHAQMIWIFVSL